MPESKFWLGGLPIGRIYGYHRSRGFARRSGIGLGLTQALLERGWQIVATSRAISNSKELKSSPNLVLVDGDAGKKETQRH